MTPLSRLGRYLLAQGAWGFLIVFGLVTASVMIVDLVEVQRSLATRADVGLLEAVRLSLLRAPGIVVEAAPFATLASCMMVIMQLNRRMELAALRAAGVSAWRFLTPLWLIAAGLGLFATFALDPLAARMETAFENRRSELFGKTPASETGSQWLRQGDEFGQTIIRADSANITTGQFQNVSMFVLMREGDADSFTFARRFDARSARLADGFWELTDAVETAVNAAPVRHPKISLVTELTLQTIFERVETPERMSVYQLPGFIGAARAAGLSAARHEVRFWGLLALPVLLLAMATLGAVFMLQHHRSGGGWRATAIGVGIAVVMLFGLRLFAALSQADLISPVLAAFAPPIAALAAGFAILARREDG